MTEQELKEIEARANAATPGPWKVGGLLAFGGYNIFPESGGLAVAGTCSELGSRTDAEFIAHAREDVPALIAEVRLWHRAKKALHYAMDREIINTCPFCSRDTRENHSDDCPIFTPNGNLK